MAPIAGKKTFKKSPKTKDTMKTFKNIKPENVFSEKMTADGVKVLELTLPDSKQIKKNLAKFSGRKRIDRNIFAKYNSGSGVKIKRIKNKFNRQKIKQKEDKIKQLEEESARAEVLLTESSGLLEVDENTYTSHVTQSQIRDAVDITSATKSFDLNLTYFGPYKFRYTKNGRHMVLGGQQGHLAAFDWVTKKLHFEVNLMESIHDVCYLHTEQMIATAQRQWVYIYDNQGIEIHCLKKLDKVLKLEFLPYHFLLCAGSETGCLSWLDVTLGKEVTQFHTRKGPLEIMCQNPYNAVLCCGHGNGTVSMWTPNTKEPVASIFCHPQPIRAMEIDPTGRYMATAATDRMLKIWDSRNMGKCLQSYGIGRGANNLSYSQNGLLAVSMHNVVEVFKNANSSERCQVYMRHRCGQTATGLQFCPYEDVLGVSTYRGFSSLVVPGSGNPNFDALEDNPYMSVPGRKEAEVKSLLSKIPSNLITLDPGTIAQVDTPTLEEKLKAKASLLYVRAPKIDFTPRYRMKGKSGSAHAFKRKQKVKEDFRREYIRDTKVQRQQIGLDSVENEQDKPAGILDRFKQKVKKK